MVRARGCSGGKSTGWILRLDPQGIGFVKETNIFQLYVIEKQIVGVVKLQAHVSLDSLDNKVLEATLGTPSVPLPAHSSAISSLDDVLWQRSGADQIVARPWPCVV